MGLYTSAKKLQMAHHDLNNIILCPGELHIVMAQLKTIAAYIENSGIDMAWIEVDLYGPSTVSQMLEGNHVKQSESAHLVTLRSFFTLYLEAFMTQEAGHCKERLTQLAGQLEEARSSREKWKYYFQNESECFIGVSKHRETNESTRPQAECFYCFEVFGYPDETRSTSFGNNFSRSLSNKS